MHEQRFIGITRSERLPKELEIKYHAILCMETKKSKFSCENQTISHTLYDLQIKTRKRARCWWSKGLSIARPIYRGLIPSPGGATCLPPLSNPIYRLSTFKKYWKEKRPLVPHKTNLGNNT
ncbi:hypothetical protein XENORESO_019831 [Xenotaenia resolanae]|uniref:Uncharacterized protein n=1 Tax=Xenotaenia resolanae TaxID=208358 RepID=A0ABV0WEE9_9TELE